ncbi:uncharacterized protein LOC125683899 [Ostrea edulis]|uniref:uncharacterized protein LOC125683899 n=1 Tax=Ostrea edulis TaxID=37623 RepID=UPI00209597EC|nr:uncharacterized protein LOC125683899 [Ostrea edulis]
MYLNPLEIRFSQDSIGSTFGRCTSHPFRPIGKTLDDILSGRCNVNSIPNISVMYKNGHWFTADNRRLWVFQEAEKRGKCGEIFVRETSYINYNKFTTMNNGESIDVRGNPGGSLWRSMREVRKNPLESTEFSSTIFAESFTTSVTLNADISFKQENQEIGFLSENCEQNVVTDSDLILQKPLGHKSLSADVTSCYKENVSIEQEQRTREETEVQPSTSNSEIRNTGRPNSMSDWHDINGNHSDEMSLSTVYSDISLPRDEAMEVSEWCVSIPDKLSIDESELSKEEEIGNFVEAKKTADGFVEVTIDSIQVSDKYTKGIPVNSIPVELAYRNQSIVPRVEGVSKKRNNDCLSARRIICMCIMSLIAVGFIITLCLITWSLA